jgi:hypothetical protein
MAPDGLKERCAEVLSDLLVRPVCHAGDDEQQVSGVQVCAASEGVDERTTGKRRAAVDDALGMEVRDSPCELDGQGTGGEGTGVSCNGWRQ